MRRGRNCCALMLGKFSINWCARRDCSALRASSLANRSGLPSLPLRRPTSLDCEVVELHGLPAESQNAPMRIGKKKAGSKPAFFVPVVRPERFELPASWFVARRSIQLSYGRK